MASKSKQKGAAGERELCALMENYFSPGKKWIKTPGSGAFTGGKNVFRRDSMSQTMLTAFSGDIIPIDEMSNMLIECKNYGDFNFHHLFTEQKVLNSWINQVTTGATTELVLIFFKISRKGWFSCARISDFPEWHKLNNCMKYNDWFLADMDEFITTFKEEIKELSKPKQ